MPIPKKYYMIDIYIISDCPDEHKMQNFNVHAKIALDGSRAKYKDSVLHLTVPTKLTLIPDIPPANPKVSCTMTCKTCNIMSSSICSETLDISKVGTHYVSISLKHITSKQSTRDFTIRATTRKYI